MKSTHFSNMLLLGCLMLWSVPYSWQAYPTIPLQAWLPKGSGDSAPTEIKKMRSIISGEFESLLFPPQVDINALCQLESPIVHIKQNIHYTDFNKASKPSSVEWIQEAQRNAKYALDVGYVSSDVVPTLEKKLKSTCPGKSLKRISLDSSVPLSTVQALTAANPQSLFVFTGILSQQHSILDNHMFFTPTLFITLSLSVFLIVITCVSIGLISSVQVGIGVDRSQRKLKQQ